MKITPKDNFHDLDEYDHSVSPRRIYEVIDVEAGNYRIIDDDGEPVAYPAYLFKVVDATVPDDWEQEGQGTEEWYASPPELNVPGLFEDYFDRNEVAVRIVTKYLRGRGLLS